jgi:hypothetical protein
VQERDPDPGPPPASLLAADAALAIALERLVVEASDGDEDSLERGLLRALVELGLTASAGIWCRNGPGEGWSPVRSFGGATPPPPVGFTTPACRAFELSEKKRVVVSRTPFGAECGAEELEATIEVLVALTATLVTACPRRGAEGASPLPQGRTGADK